MMQVTPPTDIVRRIVGRQRVGDGESLRPSMRTVTVPCGEGTLLHHTLTSETLLLDEAEAMSWRDAHGPLAPELAARRFLVPDGADELALDDQVARVLELMRTPVRGLDSFTVFTTTDCNARCFYCYELGSPRAAMGDPTALEAVRASRYATREPSTSSPPSSPAWASRSARPWCQTACSSTRASSSAHERSGTSSASR